MGFLMIGIMLVVLKAAGVGAVAHWAWWVVLAPFGLALLWWVWADRSGWTRRRIESREAARKQARVQRQRDQLGLGRAKRR